AGHADAAKNANVASLAAYTDLNASVEHLSKINADTAKEGDDQIAATYESSRTIIVMAILVATAIGLALSLFLARNIVRGARAVQSSVDSLANKCATWLAEGLERLRDNDLTYDIVPVTPLIEHYSSDEIGETARLTDHLRNKIVAAI